MLWRNGREAEGAPLLRAYGVKLIESSNLSFSAMIFKEKSRSDLSGGFSFFEVLLRFTLIPYNSLINPV